MKVRAYLSAAVLVSTLALSPNVYADATASVCNEGVCSEIPVDVGLLILLAAMFEDNINENLSAAGSESGELAKVLRGISGISVRDIQRYGLCGGKNSEARKLLGNLCPSNMN